MNRRVFTLFILGAVLSPAARAMAVEKPRVTVYRDASCGCCGAWVEHMQNAGFGVDVVNDSDLAARHSALSIPVEFAGCHVAVIGEFAFSGHVPADDISAFMSYPPAGSFGLAVPGMPSGSPGMGETGDPYEVILLTRNGPPKIFARH